jgi:DNA invertase Pin-like site-specific DNA recombinase
MTAARKGRATLIIAKLDRLARNVAFIANLMDAGVDFVAVDQPFASRLTLHILAAVAEDEARRISERTRAALAAAKARGVKLGSPIAAETAALARAARSAQARKAGETTRAVIRDVQGSGVATLAGIAKALQARGIRTPAGRTEVAACPGVANARRLVVRCIDRRDDFRNRTAGHVSVHYIGGATIRIPAGS